MFRLSDGEEIMTLAFFVLKPEVSQWLAVRRTDTDICQYARLQTPDTMASQPFLQYPAKSCEYFTHISEQRWKWVIGQMSRFEDGSRGSWVTVSDP